ncbi:hypothetical protein B9Z65_2301 [Elsinoe australis]|uniref:Uncharacterized protein n=1 Tax=Elsinoe australis TaxID=40998 RepID=A0A2P7ZAE1_9PEZI|nr:hypothetical protein B9Z65_2301 [Elsinoe australis]
MSRHSSYLTRCLGAMYADLSGYSGTGVVKRIAERCQDQVSTSGEDAYNQAKDLAVAAIRSAQSQHAKKLDHSIRVYVCNLCGKLNNLVEGGHGFDRAGQAAKKYLEETGEETTRLGDMIDDLRRDFEVIVGRGIAGQEEAETETQQRPGAGQSTALVPSRTTFGVSLAGIGSQAMVVVPTKFFKGG